METPPYRSGDFIWTAFPYEDQPDKPANHRHIACVIACFSRRDADTATTSVVDSRGLVVCVYTSSQVQKFGDVLPVGVIQISQGLATRSGNQKSYFVDVRRRAFLPFSKAYFPDIDRPDHGLVGTINRTVFSEIVRQYRIVNEKHPDLIVNLGPLRSR